MVSPLNELSGDSPSLKPRNILKLMFLLGQIYTEGILLLDALLCHVW